MAVGSFCKYLYELHGPSTKCAGANGSLLPQFLAFFFLLLLCCHFAWLIRMQKYDKILHHVDPGSVLLSLRISFKLIRATVNHKRIPGFEPSSRTIASRYRKLVTVSNFCQIHCSTCGCHWHCFSSVCCLQHLSFFFYLVLVLMRFSTRIFNLTLLHIVSEVKKGRCHFRDNLFDPKQRNT